MKNIKTEIRFGASIAVDKEEIKYYNSDIIRYKKDRMSCELGQKILDEKGWEKEEDEEREYYRVDLYVFTHEELKAYRESILRGTI